MAAAHHRLHARHPGAPGHAAAGERHHEMDGGGQGAGRTTVAGADRDRHRRAGRARASPRTL